MPRQNKKRLAVTGDSVVLSLLALARHSSHKAAISPVNPAASY